MDQPSQREISCCAFRASGSAVGYNYSTRLLRASVRHRFAQNFTDNTYLIYTYTPVYYKYLPIQTRFVAPTPPKRGRTRRVHKKKCALSNITIALLPYMTVIIITIAAPDTTIISGVWEFACGRVCTPLRIMHEYTTLLYDALYNNNLHMYIII